METGIGSKTFQIIATAVPTLYNRTLCHILITTTLRFSSIVWTAKLYYSRSVSGISPATDGRMILIRIRINAPTDEEFFCLFFFGLFILTQHVPRVHYTGCVRKITRIFTFRRLGEADRRTIFLNMSVYARAPEVRRDFQLFALSALPVTCH